MGGEKSGESEGDDNQIIVVKVDMHCEACVKKVVNSLKTLPAVDEVAVDRNSSTIAVKGSIVDPLQVCHRIFSKTRRNVQLLSPLPAEQPPKLDSLHQENNDDQAAEPVIKVVLRVQMHCEACAQLLRKSIRKVKGVERVETNVGNGEVIVEGVIANPEDLAKYVEKKTRRNVSIIVKEDEEKEESEEKKSEEIKKEEESEEEVMNNNVNGYEFNNWAANAPTNNHFMTHPYTYHPQFFSDDDPNACSLM